MHAPLELRLLGPFTSSLIYIFICFTLPHSNSRESDSSSNVTHPHTRTHTHTLSFRLFSLLAQPTNRPTPLNRSRSQQSLALWARFNTPQHLTWTATRVPIHLHHPKNLGLDSALKNDNCHSWKVFLPSLRLCRGHSPG